MRRRPDSFQSYKELGCCLFLLQRVLRVSENPERLIHNFLRAPKLPILEFLVNHLGSLSGKRDVHIMHSRKKPYTVILRMLSLSCHLRHPPCYPEPYSVTPECPLG